MMEWEGGWDVFPTVCVEVINSGLAQSPGPPEGSATEGKPFPCLFTDTSTQAHSLSFGHLPPTHSSHPGTKPNHAVLLYKDVLWWKFQTQAYHVTWGLLHGLSRPYAKSLGFGCLFLQSHTHTSLPIWRKVVFSSSKCSAVCTLSPLPPVYFSFHHFRVFYVYFISKYHFFHFIVSHFYLLGMFIPSSVFIFLFSGKKQRKTNKQKQKNFCFLVL